MPPVFRAPDPVVPSISEAYGRGQSLLAANPVLQNAAESAARMRQASNLAAADRAFRAQQADLDRAESVSQRSTAAMGRLAGINAESQQAEFDREARQRLQVQDFQARAAQQQFAAQAEAKTQEGLMVLRSQLARMDFSYQDSIELTRQNRVLQDIMTNEELTDQERAFAGLAVKSGAKGIDVLEMRQRATQARMLESRAKQYEAEVEHQSLVTRKQAMLDAKSIPDRTSYILDPAVEQQVLAEPEFGGPITQQELAQYGERAPLARRQRVAAEVARRGGLLGYAVQTGYDQNGKALSTIKEVKPQRAEKQTGQINEEDVLKVSQQIAHQVAKEASDPNAIDKPEWASKPGGSEAEVQRRVGLTLSAMKAAMQMVGGGQQPPPGGGASTAPAGPPSKPYSPEDRANMTEDQRLQEDKYEQFIDRLSARDDLAPAQKQRYVRDAQMLQTMIRKHGSLTNPAGPIPPQDQALVRQLVESLRQAESAAAPPAAPASPPPPPARAGARYPRMGIH